MRPETWIETLFGNPWRVRILRRLSAEPGRIWTEREMARALDASPNTINLAAAALRDQGILEFRHIGRSNTFRLRHDVELTRHLRSIFRLEASALDGVKKAIVAAAPADVECVLFGSTVTREFREDSDIDLLIVAPTTDAAEDAAFRIREAAAAIMPLPLSIFALSKRDADRRRKDKEPWFMDAMEHGERLGGRGGAGS